MTTWWTSDTHFSHVNIIRYCDRPFADVRQMNEKLIRWWNETVAPDDEVWHLGDLALGSPFEEQIEMTAQLHGRRRLVPGNHDRFANCYEGRPDPGRFLPVYRAAGWEIMPEQFEHEIDGQPVVVCHFPYEGDSQGKDRYRRFRPTDRGLPVIHGHVHGSFAEQGRQFNVGVDVRDYRPVAEPVIAAWLKTLP